MKKTIFFLAFIVTLPLQIRAQNQKRPNIIFILADDLGYGDVACNNPSSKIPTPNLDKMADEGMRFTDAHASAQICAPSRYGFLTGRYAFRDRKKDVSGRLTIPKMLKEVGYETAAVGKWHVQHLGLKLLDSQGKTIKPDREIEQLDASKPVKGAKEVGFDYFFGTYACPTSSRLYAYIENDKILGNPNEIFPGFKKWMSHARSGRKSADFKFEECDMVFLEKSKDFIKSHQKNNPDKPFFLYHSMQAVHLPALPADQFVGKTAVGPYGDFVYECDWIVGQLMALLKELDIDDNTLVVFTGDNGPESQTQYISRTYDHQSTAAFRGMKRDNWEGGHREVFLTRWPIKIRAGEINNNLVGHNDLLATFAEIVNYKIPKGEATDSYSFLPILENKNYSRSAPLIHFVQSGHGVSDAFAIRTPEWKLLDHKGAGSHNYLKGHFKDRPPLSVPEAPGQLYNIKNDKEEMNNLWYQNPEIVKKLQKQLTQLIKE